MKAVLALSILVTLTGCASIAGDKMQPISVKTVHNNAEIAGINCTLSNDAGSWSVMSPGSVKVHKSTGDLAVNCKKDTFAGNQSLVSKANGAVWGNIIAGGAIGYIVDRSTGAGFDYPGSVTITLVSQQLPQTQAKAAPPAQPVDAYREPVAPAAANAIAPVVAAQSAVVLQQPGQSQPKAAPLSQPVDAYQLALAEIRNRNSRLDPTSAYYNQDAFDWVMERQAEHVKKGLAPADALRLAVADMAR
jgi:hypothetical protein